MEHSIMNILSRRRRAGLGLAVSSVLAMTLSITPATSAFAVDSAGSSCDGSVSQANWQDLDDFLKKAWFHSERWGPNSTHDVEIHGHDGINYNMVGQSVESTNQNLNGAVLVSSALYNGSDEEQTLTSTSAGKTYKNVYTYTTAKGLTNSATGTFNVNLSPISMSYAQTVTTSLTETRSCSSWDETSYSIPSQNIVVPAHSMTHTYGWMITGQVNETVGVTTAITGDFTVTWKDNDNQRHKKTHQDIYNTVRTAVDWGYQLPDGFTLDTANQAVDYEGTVSVSGADSASGGILVCDFEPYDSGAVYVGSWDTSFADGCP
ncbi:ETX/MTX2 family pore-forming toxin [Streptomyces sp. MS06]|uniref:ETX/MTX2 family pore-forming toxin n=1 Tax=Streptomyces sp. MS06 TaxID=3385974 RepID=UPI0039A0FABC